MAESFEDQIKTFNEKSPGHLQNWKKIWALANYGKTLEDYEEWECLEFIIRYFKKGFLWEELERVLDKLIEKYNIDYTKWAVRDGWVKMQEVNGYKIKPGCSQMELPFFDLDKKRIETREQFPLWSKIKRHKLYR